MTTATAVSLNAPAPPPLVPPPSAAPGASFFDLLASNLAAGAAVPLASPLGIDPAGDQTSTPAPSKNTESNSAGAATVAVPVPLPPQQTESTPSGGDGPAANGSAPTQHSGTSAQASSTSAAGGSSGNGSGANGATLPPNSAQLNARVAAGAQNLMSQPTANLGALAHTAQTATPGAATPAPSNSPAPSPPTPHGTTTSDPNAVLAKSGEGTSPGAPADTAQSAAQATLEAATDARSTPGSDITQGTADATAAAAQQPDPNAIAAPLAAVTPATDFAAPTALQTASASTLAASTLDQIAFAMRQSASDGLNQIEIQLKPASLGSVDVKLEMTHDGRMTAVISSDRSDTLNLLQRNSGELQQALREAGVQADTGSLSFNLRGEQQQAGGQGGQGGNVPSAGASAEAGADQELASQLAVASAGSSHSGLLNIQV